MVRMRYLFTAGFLALCSSAVSQNLYVSSYNSGLVQAFNGATGAPLGTFATLPAGDSAGGLVFSPWDASLNVASLRAAGWISSTARPAQRWARSLRWVARIT